jgi:coenzyme F420 biosynthesis associated uncharacterized protein
MAQAHSTSSKSQFSDQHRRLIAMGLVAGVAAGVWASSKVKSLGNHDPSAGLIDWDQARGIAINMNRGQTLTAPERDRLDAYYRDLGDRCAPLVRDFTGVELPRPLEQTFAFDRVDWINANLEAFKIMFAPIEALNSENAHGSFAARLWGGVNRNIVSAEVGLMLGYLARRVLGQYDLALLGREPVTSGKLYYVEPNIHMVERALDLPGDEFRMWLALHEITHAFEFEGHDWVRPHFNALLERYFEYFKADVDTLRQGWRGMKAIVDRARSSDRGDASWIEAMMAPEQRAIFAEMQALMCIVEGYSNYVMNAVGKQLMPNFESIARKFEQRKRQRGFAEQLFARLTGLDMKLEQYRLGEEFIDRIAAEHGSGAVDRIWANAESIPTMDEIRRPEKWSARVLAPLAAG